MTAPDQGKAAMGRRGPGWSGALLAAAAALFVFLAPAPGRAGLPPGTEDGIRKAVGSDPERAELRQAMETMEAAGFPGDSFSRLLEVAGDLSRAGISVQDVCCKVREGVAKKAEAGRVMAVVADRVAKLKDGRLLVLDLTQEGAVFLDQQMAFRVVADYLSRGIPAQVLRERILARSLADFPAMENILR